MSPFLAGITRKLPNVAVEIRKCPSESVVAPEIGRPAGVDSVTETPVNGCPELSSRTTPSIVAETGETDPVCRRKAVNMKVSNEIVALIYATSRGS
jgi:hypothetical protein